jgi:hypothetical protein
MLRSKDGQVWFRKCGRKKKGFYCVETQRTHGTREAVKKQQGKKKKVQQCRPYRADEFDVVAVCMEPLTGKWEFLYTPASACEHDPKLPDCIATYQYIGKSKWWTNDLDQCVKWCVYRQKPPYSS